jgi:Skp family chaperone for outer membrane proteins
MFVTKKQIKEMLDEALGIKDGKAALQKEIRQLKDELEDLKLKKKMEETEIKHLVKLKEERQAVEADKQKNELAKTFNDKEMALQTKYHEQVMGVIQKEHEKLQALYKEIIGRLPDVNMTITKKV